MITVTGNTLEKFLDQRTIWELRAPQILAQGSPGSIIAKFVRRIVIDYSTRTDPNDVIDNLRIGVVDGGGDSISVSIEAGKTLYSEILSLAEANNLGLSLYLESADDDGYSLVFSVREGVDRTTDQTANFSSSIFGLVLRTNILPHNAKH